MAVGRWLLGGCWWAQGVDVQWINLNVFDRQVNHHHGSFSTCIQYMYTSIEGSPLGGRGIYYMWHPSCCFLLEHNEASNILRRALHTGDSAYDVRFAIYLNSTQLRTAGRPTQHRFILRTHTYHPTSTKIVYWIYTPVWPCAMLTRTMLCPAALPYDAITSCSMASSTSPLVATKHSAALSDAKPISTKL